MQHEIPTHLNVEDKMFWRLSARQVAILVSGASCAYWAWNDLPWLPLAPRGALTALVAALALALALVRPHGRALEEWAFAWLHYATMPRASTWRVREPGHAGSDLARSEWEAWAMAEHWKSSGRVFPPPDGSRGINGAEDLTGKEEPI